MVTGKFFGKLLPPVPIVTPGRIINIGDIDATTGMTFLKSGNVCLHISLILKVNSPDIKNIPTGSGMMFKQPHPPV